MLYIEFLKRLGGQVQSNKCRRLAEKLILLVTGTKVRSLSYET